MVQVTKGIRGVETMAKQTRRSRKIVQDFFSGWNRKGVEQDGMPVLWFAGMPTIYNTATAKTLPKEFHDVFLR